MLALVFGTAEYATMLYDAAHAHLPTRIIIAINPQWAPEQFGYGTDVRDARNFVDILLPAFHCQDVAVGGATVTLLRAYPSRWQVHLAQPGGRHVYLGTQEQKPNTDRLADIVRRQAAAPGEGAAAAAAQQQVQQMQRSASRPRVGELTDQQLATLLSGQTESSQQLHAELAQLSGGQASGSQGIGAPALPLPPPGAPHEQRAWLQAQIEQIDAQMRQLVQLRQHHVDQLTRLQRTSPQRRTPPPAAHAQHTGLHAPQLQRQPALFAQPVASQQAHGTQQLLRAGVAHAQPASAPHVISSIALPDDQGHPLGVGQGPAQLAGHAPDSFEHALAQVLAPDNPATQRDVSFSQLMLGLGTSEADDQLP